MERCKLCQVENAVPQKGTDSLKYCKNITTHHITKATGAGSVENTEYYVQGRLQVQQTFSPQLHLNASGKGTWLVRHQDKLCEQRKSNPCVLEFQLTKQSALLWY